MGPSLLYYFFSVKISTQQGRNKYVYEDFCAACTYLGETADSYGKYFCDKHGERIYAYNPKCHRFIEAYSRSNSARRNMYENSVKHNVAPPCYLTTTMCNILKYNDDNYYLETLRKFRDKTLKRNPKYLPLLIMYDVIGPQISYNLHKDPNKETIAKFLFNKYITKTVDAIEHEKTQEAINIYIAMTHTLENRYNINTFILSVSPETPVNTINTKTLGHAKTKKLD